MTNIQSQKNGSGPIEEVIFTAHRDPMFHTEIVDTSSVAGGNIAVDSGKINFGPRGAGRLGIVVGQLNTTDPDGAGPLTGTDIAAWTATIKVYDINGLQIGTDITQTIPLTPSGKSVLTALSIDQQVALRAQYLTLTGTIVAPALTTILKVYITEQSPEQEIAVSGDGIATEATLAALKTLADTTGLKILPADVTNLKSVTEASAASALAVAQRMNERYRASAPDMYAYTGAYSSATAFTFTADSGVTPIGANVVQVVARRKAASHGAWYDVPMTKIEITGVAPNYTVTLDDASLVADDEIIVVVRGPYRGFTLGTNSFRQEVINGLNTFRTGPQTIGAQQTFTAAYADWGAEIAVTNYNKLMLFIDKTIGTSSGLKLQILGKHTGAAAAEYVLETDIALGDATGYIAISRPALLNNCVEYIQLQIKDDAGGTGTVNAGSKYELAW